VQHCTDRLDPPLVPIRVDNALLLVSFRIQLTHLASTCEKIDAADRISFARFSFGVPAFELANPLLGLTRYRLAVPCVGLGLAHPDP